MKNKIGLLLFVFVLGADIAAVQLNNSTLQYIFKPLIILVIAAGFKYRLSGMGTGLKYWILTALFFSWCGDVLLMFQERDPVFFLSGLVAFLLAHIFYIIFFHKIRVFEKVKGNPWFLLVVVLYYAALMYFLNPYLGDMANPVRVYGIVICFMLMLAMHMLFIKNKKAGRNLMTGALLFVVSDSLLAVNKFYQSFEWSGALIMLTYGFAQYLIVDGAAHYIQNRTNEKPEGNSP